MERSRQLKDGVKRGEGTGGTVAAADGVDPLILLSRVEYQEVH